MKTTLLFFAGFLIGMALTDFESAIKMSRYFVEDQMKETRRHLRNGVYKVIIALFLLLFFR